AKHDPQYDAAGATAVRDAGPGPVNVEYHRHIAPILARSCAACHSAQDGQEPAGKLDLTADGELLQIENLGKFPGTYVRLALDERARFGHKPVRYDSWGYPQASRYIRKFQARRSLLVWKLFGERLDGFSNDDHPSESQPGAGDIVHRGEQLDPERHASRMDIDFTGSSMPPPDAVAAGKVQPLSDEDRRTILRWIDLGCPIDLDFHPGFPEHRGYGWMLDDNRPILTLARPREQEDQPLDRAGTGGSAARPHPDRHARLRYGPGREELHGQSELRGEWPARGCEPGRAVPGDRSRSLGAQARRAASRAALGDDRCIRAGCPGKPYENRAAVLDWQVNRR
ncbi:MAG: hypothetical protein MUF06_07065, partial [Pirellulaceae bacterium]|nr:hypothetical protein [Pirellulaceae bacterium]